jgi:3-phenylpropionate/cinnamic acid dioxygenase small subunit
MIQATEHAAAALLFHESDLMDAMHWDEWLTLFLPDATYWVPARPGQTDPLNEVSLIYDDLPLLQARVAQLKHPQHYANLPPVRASRHVSNIVVSTNEDEVSVRSKLLVVECRLDRQRVFAATVTHVLRATGDGLRIASKTVVLLNGDAAHEELVVPF